MIRHLRPSVLLVSLLAILFAAGRAQAAAVPGPASLFDGQSLAGWTGDPKIWRVEEGALTAEIPAGQTLERSAALFWSGEIADFDLTAEFRIAGGPEAGAGILYRVRQLPDGSAAGYAALVGGGAKSFGSIFEEQGRGLLAERGNRASIAPDGRRWKDPLADPVPPPSGSAAGNWKTCRVVARASHVEVWIDGVLCSALDDHQADASAFAGRLALQLRAGAGPAKVQFRKLQLVGLGKTEKPAYPGVKPVAGSGEIVGIKPKGADGQTLNLDFETGTLAGWKAEGNAWEGQPVEGDTVAGRQRGHSKHEGKFWIGGYERNGDGGTGRLTSGSFEVTHPWATFLIGGGADPKQERVEIVDEQTGQVLHSRSGEDREEMRRVAVNLAPQVGKRIFIRLVDESSGPWGHLNFDDFLFHDELPAGLDKAPEPAAPTSERLTHQKESPVLWHLLPNPAKPTAIANADAQNVVATMKLTAGFQAELIAAEPEVRQPIAFTFDERGRLWIAEAYSYPAKQPEGKGQDRILILEDPDGTGVFRSRKVFMEGLNLVSGLEVGFGGVWVGAAPELLFIPRDAEDHAGQPQVLLNGFGYQDTHETLNSFTWGPDGWLYGNQGVFNHSMIGAPGTPENRRVEMRSGVWRYHPVRHEFEIFANGGSNQWGLDFNSAGHLFMTHCRSFWGGGGTTNVIRNGHFWNQANGNYAPFISSTAPDFAPALKNYLPAAARYDSGAGGAGKPGTDAVYGGHSHVGTMIYLGDNWPDIYRDRLFTNNLFGHQMNQQENIRSGSGYETLHAGYDLLMAPDPRYMAVNLKAGPDGAVYIIDWCDLQHCHNPEPDKWDRTNGRVYRVSWEATYHPVKVDLGAMSDIDLANLHTHRNDWYPRMARHLLQERAAKGPIDPQALAILRQQAEQSGDPAEALKAILTLHVTGALDAPMLARLAKHESDVLRGWAVQLATEKPGANLLDQAVLVSMAKSDPSSSVRLALASALPTLPPDACWEVGEALAMHAEDAGDRFLPRMIWFGLARVVAEDPARGLALAQKTPLSSLADSARWFVSLHSAGRDRFVAQIADEPKEAAARDLRLLAFAMKDEAGAPPPAKWSDALAHLGAASEGSPLRSTADELSAIFGDREVLAKTRAVLADSSQPLPVRQQAFALLRRVNDTAAIPIFAQLLDLPEFRSAVIPMLGRSTDPATATAIIQRFAGLKGSDRTAALSALTGRPELAVPLLEAIKAGTFPRQDLTALQIRQLGDLRNAKVTQLLDETWGHVSDTSEAAKATMARFRKAYQAAPLWAFDVKAGQQTFTQVCTVCHSMNGVGGTLGPDLGGSWRNGLDYFLENIIDPNAVVGENYQLHVITKKDGSVVSGLLDKETDTAITVRTIGEPVIVAKADIQDHQKLAQSLMPPGLLEALPENKVLELLKFLTTKPEKE